MGASANPQTIGEAKTRFNAAYGRPAGGMEQSFVAEMLTSVTIAQLQPTYAPSRVFSLGFESLCTTFLGRMSSDAARDKVRTSLCEALGLDSESVRADAEALKELAAGGEEALLASEDLQAIREQKYSYPLGAGLLALMPLVGSEPSKEVIERWVSTLELPTSRLLKDWEFFKDSTEKLVQAEQMMVEMKAAAKRREAAKLKEEAEKAAKEAAEAEAKATAAVE